MIETLRIDGLAIVDRVELAFGPGLNVLTGETGTGKSVVLGALALLAGARASADGVREGADESSVEAVFRTAVGSELEAELARRGFELEDHELVVRRTVSRAGRSRARVAGELVPVGLLAELFQGSLEISSQHDSQALLRPEVHGLLLDRSGGLLAQREAVRAGYAALRELDAELAHLRRETQERVRRQDFLSFQVREIDDAGLDAEEIAGLRADRSRLAHAGRLREEGGAALARLVGDPVDAGEAAAADALEEAARRLAELSELDRDLAEPAARLTAAAAEVRDACLELSRHLDDIEADPARLAAADARLHQIEGLQRKYGESVEAVLRFRDEAAAELAAIEGADAREAEILEQREARREALERDARELTRGRQRAARRLSKAVQASLRELAMPQARFEVALVPTPVPEGVPCGPAGSEAGEFRLAANPGEAPKPLRRIASGGELSRAFLALKGALREGDPGMVLVFDEVDAGIGGRAADRVGQSLSELAAHHQVLCITHLPQIAARADAHFRVDKHTSRGRTRVQIERVTGEARVDEIARMAGGASVGEATRRHARELLGPRASL